MIFFSNSTSDASAAAVMPCHSFLILFYVRIASMSALPVSGYVLVAEYFL